jgi:hypothetical protein
VYWIGNNTKDIITLRTHCLSDDAILMLNLSIPHLNSSPNKVCGYNVSQNAWNYIKKSQHNADFRRLYGREFRNVHEWRHACKTRICNVLSSSLVQR